MTPVRVLGDTVDASDFFSSGSRGEGRRTLLAGLPEQEETSHHIVLPSSFVLRADEPNASCAQPTYLGEEPHLYAHMPVRD